VQVTLWGVRGSIPTPDADKLRYGGNTACVSVGIDDDIDVILDAGTGIRRLGERLVGSTKPVHILITHLHLDHIMGMLFFRPFFDPARPITVWGPAGAFRPLRQRLARYLSQPLSPIDIRELPARVIFREVGAEPFMIGGATVRAERIIHRGPTLGYRIEQDGRCLCYLPDHEPGLGVDLERTPAEWVSGLALAHGAHMLIHDAQYTDREYAENTTGWGHSRLGDALIFARRAESEQVVLFHHDPAHDDESLDCLSDEAAARWAQSGGEGARIGLGVEGRTIEV
jgi:phosphoribosyl 1,2-cyclic phosphodiesterase